MIWLTHFVWLLLRSCWPDLRLPALYRIYIHFSKYSIFCSEYSLFVVGIHVQLANWQSSSLGQHDSVNPPSWATTAVVARSIVCLSPVEHWDRTFKSRSRDICMRAFFLFVLPFAGSGLATGWSPSKESYRLSVRFTISDWFWMGTGQMA
jgi:hypothetical protein